MPNPEGTDLRRVAKLISSISAAVLVLSVAACSVSTASGPQGGKSASGHELRIAFVPKIGGNAYFGTMDKGGQQAAKDLGFKWLFQGGATDDPAEQADIVRSFIQQRVDALIVSPDDPNSLAPLLQQAMAQGIKVLTSDTDAAPDARQLFVNQASDAGIGKAVMDALVRAMGGKGEYGIVSCQQTAQNLNSWIAAEKAYAARQYPQVKLVGIEYAGEDQTLATQLATDLMNAHPNMTGIIGECVAPAAAIAQAVRNAGKVGKVFTVGVGLPSMMKPYINEGSSSGSILWNVQQLGYLSGWAAYQLASGKTIQSTNTVGDGIGAVTYDSAEHQLILGQPVTITRSNISQYNY